MECSGNLLLDRLVGANVVLVAPSSYEGKITELGYVAGLKDKMDSYADKLRYKLKLPYKSCTFCIYTYTYMYIILPCTYNQSINHNVYVCTCIHT